MSLAVFKLLWQILLQRGTAGGVQSALCRRQSSHLIPGEKTDSQFSQPVTVSWWRVLRSGRFRKTSPCSLRQLCPGSTASSTLQVPPAQTWTPVPSGKNQGAAQAVTEKEGASIYHHQESKTKRASEAHND